VRSSVTTRQ